MASKRKYNNELRIKRDIKIRKRYDELCNVKRDGVNFYSDNYIMNKLENEFFLQKDTIYGILIKK